MKIKEISVEVKKSHNYQTFTAGELIEMEEGDDAEAVRNEAMCRCRKQVMDQIALEVKAEEVIRFERRPSIPNRVDNGQVVQEATYSADVDAESADAPDEERSQGGLRF